MDDEKALTAIGVLLSDIPLALDLLVSTDTKIGFAVKHRNFELLYARLTELRGPNKQPLKRDPGTKQESTTRRPPEPLQKDTLAVAVIECWDRTLKKNSLPPLPVE